MKNKDYPILLDVDDVVAKWVKKVVEFVNNKYGTNFKENDCRHDIRAFLRQFWTPEVEEFIKSEGFCNSLEITEGSQDFVQELRKNNYKVMFLTSPYANAPTWCHDRIQWLKSNFDVKRDDVIFARDKRYVAGLALIDDKVSNVVDWHLFNKKMASRMFIQHFPIIKAQPWNSLDVDWKNHKTIKRIDSFDKILEVLL